MIIKCLSNSENSTRQLKKTSILYSVQCSRNIPPGVQKMIITNENNSIDGNAWINKNT